MPPQYSYHMVAYFCHILSDNYSDLSDLHVELSDLRVDLSLIHLLENKNFKTCSCAVNAIQITTKLSDKST